MAGYEQYEEWERQNEEALDADIEAGTRKEKGYPDTSNDGRRIRRRLELAT